MTYPSDRDNSKLLAKIQAIKDCYSKCIRENEELAEDLIDRNVVGGRENINNISLAWDFKYFLAPPGFVDRTRGMLAGPFYSSKKHPWPRSKKGLPAEPIIQIDLDEVSSIRGDSYGTGLLQIFADGIDLVTRLIPRSDIYADELTECEVEFSAGDSHMFYQFDESPNHLTVIRQIVGYEDPYICSEVESYEGGDAQHPRVFQELNRLLKGVRPGETQLFGTYSQIQFRDCKGELLVGMEETDGFVWGDMGNAQVFIERTNGKFRYCAQWSCG